MAVTKFPADYPKKIDAKKVERERAKEERKKGKRFKGGEKICRSETGFGRREGGTRVGRTWEGSEVAELGRDGNILGVSRTGECHWGRVPVVCSASS